jgi:hypothetical protein
MALFTPFLTSGEHTLLVPKKSWWPEKPPAEFSADLSKNGREVAKPILDRFSILDYLQDLLFFFLLLNGRNLLKGKK